MRHEKGRREGGLLTDFELAIEEVGLGVMDMVHARSFEGYMGG
jgi:hypothetical protein